jgi:hypothetical protein
VYESLTVRAFAALAWMTIWTKVLADCLQALVPWILMWGQS